jgi:fatty acid desaturase
MRHQPGSPLAAIERKRLAMEVVLSDPTYQAPQTPSPFEQIATRLICDRRDAPFLGLMALLTLTVVPTGIVLFVPGAFRWWLAAVHFGLVVYFLGPFVLMLHNTSHRRLFRHRWRWMNLYIPWVLGPFFGESPETYFAHHVGMHHAENNLDPDLSSTMRYQRDSALHFARYFLRFFFFGIYEIIVYFARKRRRALLTRFVVGELFFLGGLVALFVFVDWRAALVVFLVPFVVARFAMMAGNWGQHAFVDEKCPENNYRNSITCINSSYNRRCFNDGYHIGHHIKATRHWTEMPEDFQRNLQTYAAEGALVFAGVDFFQVWAALMLRRYDWLVRWNVPLGEEPLSREELVRTLRVRTRRIEAVGDWASADRSAR